MSVHRRLSFMMPADEYDQVARVAEADDRTVSSVTRLALRSYLDALKPAVDESERDSGE